MVQSNNEFHLHKIDLDSKMVGELIEKAKEGKLSDSAINEYLNKIAVVSADVVVNILTDIEICCGSNTLNLSQLKDEEQKMITVLGLTECIASITKKITSMLPKISKENQLLIVKKTLELRNLRDKYILLQRTKDLQHNLSLVKKMNEPLNSKKHEVIHNEIKRHAGDLNISSMKGVSTFRGKDLLKRLEQVDDLQTIHDDWSDKMDSMDLTDEYIKIVNNVRSDFEKNRHADVSEGLGKLRWAFPSNGETKKFLELIKDRQRHTFR